MNINNEIGFENGRPVATDEFDYDSTDTGTTDSSSGEAANTSIPEHFREMVAKGQALFLTWAVFRTKECSLNRAEQSLAKCAVALFDVDPKALGLKGKPTLANLARTLGFPKQEIRELYQDYKKEVRFQFRGGKATKRNKLAPRHRRAKATSNSGEKITTYQTEIEFGQNPKSIPEHFHAMLAKWQAIFLKWAVFRTKECSLNRDEQSLVKCAVALFDVDPKALGLKGKPIVANLARTLALPRQKIYELNQDYKTKIRLQFRGGETKKRKLGARRRRAKAASDSGETITTTQVDLPFGPTPKHPYGG